MRDLRMREALRGIKVGPLCLHCGETVPVRRQRHGWLCDPCETASLTTPEHVHVLMLELEAA